MRIISFTGGIMTFIAIFHLFVCVGILMNSFIVGLGKKPSSGGAGQS